MWTRDGTRARPWEMSAREMCENQGAAPARVCLFGGTFDPVHLGHLHIAQAAAGHLGLDRVVFLPCRQSPHKAGRRHADGRHRLEMCRLATAGHAWASVDDFDLAAPAPCYSWRTAEAMQEKHPGARLFWLMGTDQWQALPRWNRPEHLASLVEFIVYQRGDGADPRDGYRMHPLRGSHPASATAIRRGIAKGLHKDWIDPAVLDYILANGLYQTGGELGQADG